MPRAASTGRAWGWLASGRGEGGGCFSCQDVGDKWPTSSSLSAVPTLHTERQEGRALLGPGRKRRDREGDTAVMGRGERMRPLNACRGGTAMLGGCRALSPLLEDLLAWGLYLQHLHHHFSPRHGAKQGVCTRVKEWKGEAKEMSRAWRDSGICQSSMLYK